jgi:hypothetical protein
VTKDLMYKDEIQQLVADAYRALDDPGGPGTRFYTDEQLDALPDGARDWALGVGNPWRRRAARRRGGRRPRLRRGHRHLLAAAAGRPRRAA